MESWPANVPYEPLANTLNAEPFRAPNATEFEDGPRRARPRSTLRVATQRFTIRMSNEAFALFKAWVDGPLVQGTQQFTMMIWTAGQYQQRVCKFVEPPREDPGHGLRYRVSIVIDVWNY